MTEIKYQYLDSLNDKNTLSLVRDSHTGDILTARTVRDEQVAPIRKCLVFIFLMFRMFMTLYGIRNTNMLYMQSILKVKH